MATRIRLPASGSVTLLAALLLFALSTGSGAGAPPTAAASAARSSLQRQAAALDDLWCRYGLAACGNATTNELSAGVDNALPHASGAHGSGHAQAAATPPSTRLGQQLADPAGGSPDRVTGRQLSEATGTVPAAGRLGSAAAEAVGAAKSAVAQAAQQAAAAGAQAPTWALLLLGASVGAAVAVQLWHLLAPRRNLVVRQGSTAAEEQAAEGLALPADGSTLADVRIGAAEQLLMPASIQLASAKQPEQAVGELSPPGSPASPSARGPPALCVDPTVRARDASKREWAMTAPDEQRRTSEFHNPLFGSGSGELRCEGSLEAEGEGSSVGSPAGTSPTQGGRPWPTKEAALHLGRGDSEAADGSDNFRVPAGLPAPAPGPSSGSSSHSSSAGRELASPGSPGKAPRGAARKLTGAKSVGPQELLPPLEEVEEEEAGAAPAAAAQADLSTRDATAKRAGGNGSSGSSRTQTPAVRPSPHAPSCSSGPASPRADALRGLCLLSPAQFQEEVQLGRLLGAGAAGSVYAAEWRGLQVAVKLMHPAADDMHAFAREVKVMAGLGKHPNVVGVLAACLEPPLAVVQELAAGSLHDVLHVQGRRPQYGLLMQLAEDIAAALDHCHTQRPPVVHRDLSAKNVLLGADGRARLADFGLAAHKRRTFLSADKAGALGTASYMAPEAMAAGQISERCDGFSYAVLVWEMLTGRVAWEEMTSPMQIMYAVGVERRRLPIPAGCPPALARLLKDCWRHNAPLRPSMREVLSRLRTMRNHDAFKLGQRLMPATAPGAAAAVGSKAGAAQGVASGTATAPGNKAAGTRFTPIAAHSGTAQPPAIA